MNNTRCAECQKSIRLGDDIFAVEIGVLGQRGPVPLEELVFLCSEQCLAAHYSDEGKEPVMKMRRRIP